MNNDQTAHANRLTHESSPYLKQHAYNPVDWYPWGKEALERAKDENKPILLSIGYSSCHWCHVMAHESFENDTIAAFMNKHFVNIKLDREERPDIDHIYMEAIQTMGLRGGWPLNVFLTPDQKPFYGGTYFPPGQWQELLKSIVKAYDQNYEKLYESATRFAEAMQQSEIRKYGLTTAGLVLQKESFDSAVAHLSNNFDPVWGGMQKAPKFPMPSVWEFLGVYYDLSKDENVRDHLLFTLDKMVAGGIYDQIGGGFARYSVDGEWHVPHFEKMLYDNGQLLSLYATGYRLSPRETYRDALVNTAKWLEREMLDPSGGFYSALDADSEGEEGKFYVWSFDEVKAIAGDQFSIMAEYYDVTREGNWEGTNVLRRLEDDEKLASELRLTPAVLRSIVQEFNAKALNQRSERVRPGLDDKIIAGWNGLTLAGLCDAWQATGDGLFLQLASKNAQFLLKEMITEDGLLRIKGQASPGFLEDYGAVIWGFTSYYETTFDETYLNEAARLADRAIREFYDEKEGFFFYTSDEAEQLIARKKELFDNVIPSSNSIMANNLYRLGIMLDREDYKEKVRDMVQKVSQMIVHEPEYLSNWGITALMMASPTPEILIVGDSALEMAVELHRAYLPNKILMATSSKSTLPLFQHKESVNGKTTIFVCYDKTCRKPVHEIQSALEEINNRQL